MGSRGQANNMLQVGGLLVGATLIIVGQRVQRRKVAGGSASILIPNAGNGTL